MIKDIERFLHEVVKVKLLDDNTLYIGYLVRAKEELTKNGYFYLGDNTTLNILDEIEIEDTIKKRYIINND